MGFNRKSDAGPYEGMTGQQRYMSDVLYGYYPLLIDALNYQMFGCNAIFTEPSFKIHEAYGVNTTIEKSIVQIAETITIEEDVLDKNYSVNQGSLGAAYLYSMLTVSSYYYGSETYNHKVNEFVIATDDILKLTTDTLYYPVLPVLQPYKFMHELTGPNMAFAMHQLQIPILRSQSTIPNTDNSSIPYVKSVGSIKYNNSLYAKSVLGIDNAYVSGKSALVDTNIAKWSDTAGSQDGHMRGMHLEFAANVAYTELPVMIYLYSGNAKEYGFVIGVLPNNQTMENYYGAAITDVTAKSRAYGLVMITEFKTLYADLTTYIAGTINLGPADSELFCAYFIRYLYYLYHNIGLDNNHIAVKCGNVSAINGTNEPIEFDFDDAALGFEYYCKNLDSNTVGTITYPTTAYGIGMAGTLPPMFQSLYTDSQRVSAGAFAFLARLYTDDATTYDYIFPISIEARAERQYNGTDYHTHGYPILWDDPCKSTNIVIASNESGRNASFYELTLSGVKVPTHSITLIVGFYQSASSLGDTVPGFINKVLSFAVHDIYSDTPTAKFSYMIDDPYDVDKLNDPVLYGHKIMTAFECGVATGIHNYKINNIATGVADTGADEPANRTTTAINLLTPIIDTGTTKKIIYVDNYKQGDEVLEISSPIVSSLISLTEKYDLTYVKYNGTYAYFGILDIDTMNHYTPRNLFNSEADITELNLLQQLPTITDIKLIKKSDNNLECVIKYHDNTVDEDRVIYLTMQKLKNIGAGVFYTDPYYREQFVLQLYRIDYQNNQLLTNEPSISDHGMSYEQQIFDIADAGSKKNIGFIEYDNNVAITNNHNSAMRLNLSSITSFHNYNFMNKANFIIRDVNDFVSNAYTFPVLHPVDALLPYNDDVGYLTYNALATLSDSILCQQILYFATMLMNYFPDGDYCLGGEARDVKTGSIIVGVLPSIDKNIRSYSVLPEKATTVFRVDDSKNLQTVGINVFSANDKSYTEIGDNLFLSSSLAMVPSNTYGLFNIQGKIFATGNLFFVTDNRQTHVYSIDENSIPRFMKSIDGIIVCDPVNVGEELIIICNNGIHSLKRGTIYNFDINITVADIKPITGNGYLLYIYSADTLDDVSLRAMNGVALVAMNGFELYVVSQSDNYRTYHINDMLNVIRLEIAIDGLDPANMQVIRNNCYGSTINIHSIQEPSGTYSYIPWAYMVAESGTYHASSYIISEPVQLRNQKAEIAIVDTAYIYCQGYGTVQIQIYDGAVAIVDKTVTIGTNNVDEYDEYKVELGMIKYDNLYYKLTITPGATNVLKVQTVKFRLNYLQET